MTLGSGQKKRAEESFLIERYRLYAEELRTMAEDDKFRRTREMLETVARDYEQMAESMQSIEDARESIRKL